MSLILSSPVAPQALPAPAASQTGRNGSQDRNDADSFGAVLRRSQESTEKTPGKSPEKTAVQRHPQDRDISKKTEQSDPASALVLAFIALEPRLAAAPASATPSDATGAVAVALGTDASLSVTTLMTTTPGQSTHEQLALSASGQNVTDEQHGVIAPLTNLAVSGLQDDAAPIVLANATTAASPHALDGDAPVILVSAAAETSPRLTAQQIALATTGQREPASALLSTKNATADNSSTVRGTENTGKIASQAALSDIGATAQQSQQGDTASDSRDGKFSVKPDLRRSEIPTAVVAANIADAATNTNITPADQFSISASAAVNPASMLQQIPAGTTPQIATTTPVSLPLAPPVGSNEWGDALGKQVAWMGNANHQIAELQLNPAGLGPLKITLTINNHQAEALFVSAHPAVRAAVEAALPQLRTNLADNGISLGNTSVSADTQQQQQQSAFAQDQAGQPSQARYRPDSVGALNTVDDLSLPDTAPSVSSSRNNVDIFA